MDKMGYEQGLIRYTRGTVTVLDRKGLEKCTCECYTEMTALYNQLLS